MNSSAEPPQQTERKVPRPAVWIATGFGLGYLPIAPGTWGSLGGIAVTALLWQCGMLFDGQVAALPAALVSAVLIGLIGVWASRLAAIHFRKPDPGPVVVDEVSGQQITYLPVLSSAFAPGGWKYLLLGFILFRVFDIVKPWPARQAEKWPNGWGIMADDWFAGLYAALCLWAVRALGWM